MKALVEAGQRVAALVLVAVPLIWMVVAFRDNQLRLSDELKASLGTPAPSGWKGREAMIEQLRKGEIPPPLVRDGLVARRAP